MDEGSSPDDGRVNDVRGAIKRAAHVTVGSTLALGLLIVLLLWIDLCARRISEDPTRGVGRLFVVALYVGVFLGFYVGLLALLSYWLTNEEPFPDTRGFWDIIEWAGAAAVKQVFDVVCLGSGIVAVGVLAVAGLAAFWGLLYGTTRVAMFAFGISFGWGLLIAIGAFFLVCCVGGFVGGRRPRKQKEEPPSALP